MCVSLIHAALCSESGRAHVCVLFTDIASRKRRARPAAGRDVGRTCRPAHGRALSKGWRVIVVLIPLAKPGGRGELSGAKCSGMAFAPAVCIVRERCSSASSGDLVCACVGNICHIISVMFSGNKGC